MALGRARGAPPCQETLGLWGAHTWESPDGRCKGVYPPALTVRLPSTPWHFCPASYWGSVGSGGQRKRPCQWRLVCVLVFCNTSLQIQWQHHTHFLIHSSVGQKSRNSSTQLTSLLRVSQGCHQGVSYVVFLPGDAGDKSVSKFLQGLATFSSLLL